MRRSLVLAGIVTVLSAAAAVAQEKTGGSFWDTKPSKADKAATAAAPAAPAGKATSTGATATTPRQAEGTGFWDARPASRQWSGWNASEPKAPAAPAVAPSPAPAAAPRATGARRARPPRASAAPQARRRGVVVDFGEAGPAAAHSVMAIGEWTPPLPPADSTDTPRPDLAGDAPSDVPPAAAQAPPAPQVTRPPAQPTTPSVPGSTPAATAVPPAWFKLSFLQRGRLEAWRGTVSPDTYFLNRVRVQAEVMPASWLRAVVQLQDARVADYAAKVKPTGMFNEIDLRLAFAEVKHARSRVTARLGRQELEFGDGRLVAPSNWGNVTRSFDAALVTVARKPWAVTTFAAQLVLIDSEAFDRGKPGEYFYGAYGQFTTPKAKRVFEPYALVRTRDRAVDERGRAGDALTATVGLRAAGTLPGQVDYNAEAAYQGGHNADDTIRAWAMHAGAGIIVSQRAWKPRFGVDYDRASGDRARRDGKKGTFDPLYPSSHAKWGLSDRVSWSNMQHAGALLSVAPRKTTKVQAGVHRYWVVERADGYYNGSGARVAPLASASSDHLGDSVDLEVTVRPTKFLAINAGVGYFFVGPFLREANRLHDDQWTHFLMWTFTF